MRALLRNEERFRKGVVLKSPALVRIPAQHLSNRRVERHDARLMELRFAYDEARWQIIQLDVIVLEPECFPNSQSRSCQRADEGTERVWAE